MKTHANPFVFGYEGFTGNPEVESDQYWVPIGDASHYPVQDSWESYEFAVTLDTVSVDKGGQGRVKFSRNGILIADITDHTTLKNADAYSHRALLFTYWNGGSPKDQHMYADEIIITNETPSERDSHGNYYLKGFIDQRLVMTLD